MWDLIISVPDHCLSFYFVSVHRSLEIITMKTFSRTFYFTIVRTFPIIVFAIKRTPTSY